MASPISVPIREQSAALVRAFLARFFENEITRGTDDLKSSFFLMAGILTGPGVYIPIMMSMHWSVVGLTQGSEALQIAARGDKAFYLGLSIVVSAVVSAIAWNSLLPDRRDGLILGALPVHPSTVVVAKLMAIVAYLGLVGIAMHSIASVLFGFALATGGTFSFLLRGILAHIVASFMATACVLLAVTAVQGMALAAAGPRLFARLSLLLQAALVAATAAALAALPVINSSTVHTLSNSGTDVRPWILSTPPLWFLGVYEWVLGTSDPVLLDLARTGVLATIATVMVTIMTYPLAYRRVMVSVVESGPSRRRKARSSIMAAWLVKASGPAPGGQAVAQLYLATLARSDRHRFVLATVLGLVAAWTIPAWLSIASSVPEHPRLDLLSLPLATMAFLATGLRVAASIPGDLKAAWLFDVSAPSRLDVRRAMERLMFFMAVLPPALAFAPIYWWLWGPLIAITHSGLALAMGALLVQLLLWRFDGSVCTRPWNIERVRLGRFWPAYLSAFLAFTAGVPLLELIVIDKPLATAGLIACVALAGLLVRYSSLQQQFDAEFEWDAAPGEILGLN